MEEGQIALNISLYTNAPCALCRNLIDYRVVVRALHNVVVRNMSTVPPESTH
jgi:hypothetical protein